MDEIAKMAKSARAISVMQYQISSQTNRNYDLVTLAEITDARDIAAFFDTLRIEPSLCQAFGLQCGCAGDFTLRVEMIDGLTNRISICHGQQLRIPSATMGDSRLTTDSAYDLGIWLSEHGIIGKRREYIKSIQQGG